MSKGSVILIFALVFFLSGDCYSQYLNSLKLNQNNSFTNDSSKSPQYHSGKNAFLAGTLSLIGPGFALGQIYNNDWPQFFFHITISSACIVGAIVSFGHVFESPSENINAGYGLLLGATLIYTANWVWSVIDAAATADKIDRQKFKSNQSGIIDKLGFGILIDRNKKLNLKFAIGL